MRGAHLKHPGIWRILDRSGPGRMTEMTRTTTRPDDPGLIGQAVGEYRIVAPLSVGGMGAIYRAKVEATGAPAAIKVLRPELTGNDELVQRFFTEAKAASSMRDPNIVAIYGFGHTDDGLAYIAMELLEGQSLAHRIRDRKPLPELEAAAIARGIASGLTAAHGKGIIHRDLKPDNIFLVPDAAALFNERPVLLDFGIAKLADPTLSSVRTQTGALIGTPLYMAPEQARAASSIDARADLYSLGCILYELLVGAPPFVAEGAGEIIAMHMFTAPEAPRARLPSISPELEAITLKLLDKEPDGRYATAAETAAALGAVLGRLSGRPSTVLPGAGASLPEALYTPSVFPLAAAGPAPAQAGPSLLSGRMPMLHEDEPPPVEKKSLMPVIAAVMTVAIAGAGIFFVWNHGAAAPPPVAIDAAIAPVAVVVDAAVPPPVAPADAAVARPVVVTAGSGARDTPEHPSGPTAATTHGAPSGPTTHGAPSGPTTHGAPSGPTTTISDGPVTMPGRDPNVSTGGSPIFPVLDVGSAAAPAPTPTPPPPAPAAPPDPATP